MMRRSTIAWLAGAVAGACATTASAELTYTVDVGAGHSDNITRVPDDEISESMAAAGLTLEWQESRRRLVADVSIDADYVHYLDDTYDGEIVGGLDGTLDFSLIPERLRWVVQDSFGQQSTDPFSPQTPDTRENVNYFTTGPTLEFLLGRQLARVYGLYSMTDYERSSFDSDRLVGGFNIGRSSPGGRGFAINGVTEQVTFKEAALTDFDRHSLYGSYSIEGSRTEISAEAGYTWLELEDGTKSGDPRFQLQVARELNSSSTLRLRAGTQLTDSSEALRASFGTGAGGGGAPLGGSGGVSAASDPFRNRFGGLTWDFNKHRTSLSLGIDYSDDTYETQSQLDRNRVSYRASVGRQLTSRLSIGIDGTLSDEEVEFTGNTNETLDYGASLDWQLGPTMGLRLELDHSERATDGATNTGEYSENRVWLSFVFRNGTGRRPGSSAP
jgi:hypothetical protein